jgi:hypothetical protein
MIADAMRGCVWKCCRSRSVEKGSLLRSDDGGQNLDLIKEIYQRMFTRRWLIKYSLGVVKASGGGGCARRGRLPSLHSFRVHLRSLPPSIWAISIRSTLSYQRANSLEYTPVQFPHIVIHRFPKTPATYSSTTTARSDLRTAIGLQIPTPSYQVSSISTRYAATHAFNSRAAEAPGHLLQRSGLIPVSAR